MSKLGVALDVLVNAREKLKDNDLLEGDLKYNIGEAFNELVAAAETIKEIKEYITKMGVVSISMTNIKNKLKDV